MLQSHAKANNPYMKDGYNFDEEKYLTLSYRDPFPGEKVTIFLYTIIVKASTKINLQFFLFKSVDKYYFPSGSCKTHTKMFRQQDCVIELGK